MPPGMALGNAEEALHNRAVCITILAIAFRLIEPDPRLVARVKFLKWNLFTFEVLNID